MGRRPSSKKPKVAAKPRPIDRRDSKLKRWERPSDFEMDEEDRCACLSILAIILKPHAKVRMFIDQIMLDGNDDGAHDEIDFEEEEVFALEGISEDEEDEVADGFGVEDEEQDVAMDDEEIPAKKRKSKSKSKKTATDSSPPHTDEEETWGRGKHAYYSSNAAQIDSDDEEAQDLEEQEARRLQAKARDEMHDDDFGLGETIQGDVEPEDAEYALNSCLLPLDAQTLLGKLWRYRDQRSRISHKISNRYSVSLSEKTQRLSHLHGTGKTRR